ncbi:hypothetical protein JAAARDRAFT_141629, partial [Jaapia argillacea MUCL 33604]
FTTRTLYCALNHYHTTGSVAKAQAIGRGQLQKLHNKDCQHLLTLTCYKPTLFLDEYASCLLEYRFLPASITTIHQSFQRAGLNVKRVQKMAAERDPAIRADFARRIGEYPADYLVTMDEVSKDDHTYARLWGCKGIITSSVVEGSFHRDTFIEYLRDDVV